MRGKAGNIGVGGVDHEQINAFFTGSGETAKVSQPAVEGQLVHFEIAGVQNRPSRGAQIQRQGVRDGVVHREKLDVEGAKYLTIPLGYGERVGGDFVLVKLRLNQGNGQR